VFNKNMFSYISKTSEIVLPLANKRWRKYFSFHPACGQAKYPSYKHCRETHYRKQFPYIPLCPTPQKNFKVCYHTM
jgi:hypothetical protein